MVAEEGTIKKGKKSVCAQKSTNKTRPDQNLGDQVALFIYKD